MGTATHSSAAKGIKKYKKYFLPVTTSHLHEDCLLTGLDVMHAVEHTSEQRNIRVVNCDA